ncbi:MAG: hypothetical protein JJ971_01895 [Balneolaceae bacterium]|nr:hypothetical protein [Balneolaceae bacterium]MBO6545125.1 hypothetical protein [Balneolaceae bacterium]MBO6646521.1 hypothetical protein [Balneolaceae bacterium]
MATSLFNNWIPGHKRGERYVYFNLTTEEMEDRWAEKARTNQQKGISVKETLRQAELTFDEAQLAINSKHYRPIHTIETELSKVQDSLDQVSEHFEDYIESELKIIPDKTYARIDRLHAKVARMQSQSDEHETYDPNSKGEHHEG